MIASTHPQGSPEWLVERAGIPTSSSFDMIVTSQGQPSKQRQKYLYTLAAERITGAKLDHYQSMAMAKGIELEAEARAMYEFLTDSKVEQVGVCFPDERRLYGASPDGLIGQNGALELKCPMPHTHVAYLLKNTLPAAYYPQIQGQLLVSQRKWVDFMSYCPGLKPLLIRVKPDSNYLRILEEYLNAFCKELDEVTEKLRRT